MIVFEGLPTGEAKKYFVRRYLRHLVYLLTFFTIPPLVMIICIMSFRINILPMIGCIVCAWCVLPFLQYLFQFIDDYKDCGPQKIAIQNDTITMVSQMKTRSCRIQDVKTVREYDDF